MPALHWIFIAMNAFITLMGAAFIAIGEPLRPEMAGATFGIVGVVNLAIYLHYARKS